MSSYFPRANPESQGANDMRRAGCGPLSLALMDARNRTLQLLAYFETALNGGLQIPQREDCELPQWIAGHVAWLAEYWIGRNPQRAAGPACPRDAIRLASIEPQADRWFDPVLAPHGARWTLDLPGFENLRGYLLETLESTLEMLEKIDGGAANDNALYFFRVALFHEARRHEQLATLAQTLGVSVALQLPQGMNPRDPVLVPAGPWRLGEPPGGFVFDVQKWAHDVRVPEFEIDAQPVNWAQYAEFVDDGGYDREELWLPQGWQWLQREAGSEGRRGPRYVEQIGAAGGAVLRTVFGRQARMAGTQSVMHLSWWEADAYARWAGRRLPTEVEWEMAAELAVRRGFRWGDVREWTAGSLRPWPGFAADRWTVDTDFEAAPHFGIAKVQRGASFATSELLRDARQRNFALPHRDDAFVGFRTCSI